ncbi:STM4015 family protein [Paenibacillus methanolicus]|uniref:Leucine rich repeat (LRR) protein n=1 Tax=Paenibacillus methanolicus TaxID=582686 RepID=A0A5S5CI57_9BACL|nr:STM4015 family protein [Paenibacillus methanolicus]TYP79214.1 leucine rich repeat (LRR) protein [Paenibacillus methanolicus]
MSEKKLAIEYDQYENGEKIEDLLEALAASPDSKSLTSLIIGDWGGSYENDSSPVVETLVRLRGEFPALRKLYIGDMTFEECEVSWINQSNLGPLLEAFPELTSLTIKGSTGLALDPARHEKLEELIIICGGLGKDVLASIGEGHFPKLNKLELYLGVDNYGFDGGLQDVMPLIEPGKFPELIYLGLKDSEIQDEIAIAVADAPILDQLHTLDLSMGTLSDKGAEALLASDRVRKLKHLDLSYHYMSDETVERWQASGLSVDVSEQQESDDEDDWRYPALTE